MNIEEYREYCLSIKGVTESFPFDEHTPVSYTHLTLPTTPYV